MACLNQFIENPGLQYVAEQIFVDLDPKSLSICRLISRGWKNFVDSRRCLIHLQIQQLLLKRKSKIEKMDSAKKTWFLALLEDTENINSNIKAMNNMDDILEILKFLRKCWIHNICNYFGLYPWYDLNDPEYCLNILNLAADKNHSNIVAILLDQCQNLRIKSYHGATPLHIACQLGHTDTIQLLLEHSVAKKLMSFDSKCCDNMTPLYHLCWHSDSGDRTVLHAMEFILDFSVKNKIDINLNSDGNSERMTPLHRICSNGSIELLKLVFNHPASKNTINIGAQTSEGRTLMHDACRSRRIEIVKFILDYSFENNIALDLNVTDDDGCSALWDLFYNEFETDMLPTSFDVLELILNHPVAQDIKIEDQDIFWLNLRRRNVKAVQVLLDFALKTDQDPGLNIEYAYDDKKVTPIVYALRYRIRYKTCMEIAQLLLTHPISKKYLIMNVHLHLACYNGLDDVVKYLFDHCITNGTTLHKEYDYETPIDILSVYGKTYLMSKKST